MKSLFSALSVLSVLGLAACGTVPTNDAVAGSNVKNYNRSLYEQLSTDKVSLYDQIGGRPTIERVMKESVVLFLADVRINRHFAKTNADLLALQLTEQVCHLAGGPCKYEGKSMEAAHKGMNLTQADFVALVEDVQIAIRKNGLSFEQENKILALLAPMKPVVVGQ
jgi:hemoglobin